MLQLKTRHPSGKTGMPLRGTVTSAMFAPLRRKAKGGERGRHVYRRAFEWCQ